jgi:hypothetical protein
MVEVAKDPTRGPIPVTVLAPFQVTVAGTAYGPGETVAVDEGTAAAWVRNGWVDLVDDAP